MSTEGSRASLLYFLLGIFLCKCIKNSCTLTFPSQSGSAVATQMMKFIVAKQTNNRTTFYHFAVVCFSRVVTMAKHSASTFKDEDNSEGENIMFVRNSGNRQ